MLTLFMYSLLVFTGNSIQRRFPELLSLNLKKVDVLFVRFLLENCTDEFL